MERYRQRRFFMDRNTAPAEQPGTGYLVVQVTTANTAIPLEGASVQVSRDEAGPGAILYERRTGPDGRTDRLSLSAPPRNLSLSPSTGEVFSAYNIEVFLPGYERALYQHVPIFDGITAIQQANLIPLPEAGYTDDFTLNAPQLFDEAIDFGL
jgi:hypothetical protein